jgi:hypothetical protein
MKKDEFEIPRTRTERKPAAPPPMPKDDPVPAPAAKAQPARQPVARPATQPLLSPAEIRELKACCDPFLGVSTQMKRVIPIGVTATVLVAIASFFLVTGVVRARATEPRSTENISFAADDLDTADLTSR